MAFDQNSIVKDLRPINVRVVDETRIAPPGPTTSGRVSDGFYPNPSASPQSMMVHYTDATGFTGLGYAPNLGQPHVWPPRMGPPPPSTTIASSGYAYSPSYPSRNDQASEDGGDDSVSGRKVKFLCSFGGKILPRPSDGMLRYVGGQTRIISVRRDVSFADLVQKMMETYGQSQSLMIKYQLPDEDLDALVSVSCPDDLDNMMEEYQKLLERSSGDGSAKLRVFLFSSSSELLDSLQQFGGDFQDTGQRYVDAVNGIVDGGGGGGGGITRKGSIASAASTQNSDFSAGGADNSNIDAHVNQEVTGTPSTSLFSPTSDSNDAFAALPLNVPAPTPLTPFSQPEIDLERTIPLQLPIQQHPPRYNKFPPPPSPYLGGYADPHQDGSIHTDYQKMVYANPQMLGAARPILIQPQYRDNAPTLLTQQFIPGVHMTMAPPSSHLSVNPNIVQPVTHKVVAVPSDQSYNKAYPPHIGGGFGWNQATPQDHGAHFDGWLQHQQGIPRTTDCYMCQKALPHAHSDPVVQDQNDVHATISTDANPIYHSLRLDDIRRLPAISPPNQGVAGLVGDVQNPYSAPRTNLPVTLPEDSTQQHLPLSSQMNQEVLVKKPVNGDNTNTSGVTYQIPEQFALETSREYSGKILGVPSAEDVARPSVSNARPVDLMTENLQINSADVLSSNELGKLPDTFEQVLPQILGRETIPIVVKPSEILPCSIAEVPYNYNIHAMEGVEAVHAPTAGNIGSKPQANLGIYHFDDKPSFAPGDSAYISDKVSPSNDMRDDTARFQAITVDGSETVAPNWGAMMDDSSCSLFSNQDPWDMRHDAPFPPPKPSKITTRDVQGDNCLAGEEYNVEAHLMDEGWPTPDQVQTGKGLEERIKQQLQATAEGVAASVIDSSTHSNLDFSSHEIDVSVSEVSHETEGKENSDEVIQTKMEAMDLKPEKTNFGFPLSDGIGRLQIIKNSDLEELRELGSGTFGTVYHGKWRGTDVAIKRINDRCFAGKPSEQERMRDDFWNEAIKLADLHHPNVVAFYGVVLDGPGGSVATVTEYMINGSLRTALQKNERNLDKRKRLLILMDVAFGMEYLHSKNIVHFDLKSDNLLVNLRDPHRPICKVGDLGLSKVKCQTLISGGVRGTLPWMAPELLNGSSSLVSEKVDVFSFGIVMWELLTGEEPYADLHYGAIIGGIVSNTLRPPVPENCDPEWRSLMEKCWSAEPPERPNFTEIANELRSMAVKVPPKGQGQTGPANNKPNS